jgi:hypothetical protein
VPAFEHKSQKNGETTGCVNFCLRHRHDPKHVLLDFDGLIAIGKNWCRLGDSNT